jgi:hypothetical protein
MNTERSRHSAERMHRPRKGATFLAPVTYALERTASFTSIRHIPTRTQSRRQEEHAADAKLTTIAESHLNEEAVA